MAINEHDLQLYARRVRPYFAVELRDSAEELALAIAWWAGPKTKWLRPATTLGEILSWIEITPPDCGATKARDSLDAVEAVMQMEEELGCELPDALLGQPGETTFLTLMQQLAEQRARITTW